MSYRSKRWSRWEVDLSAEATQSLSANQDYTIAGKTWTKVNSTNDQTAMALTNGTGLVITPKAGSTDYSADGSTRTVPMLKTRLDGIITNFHPGMWIRAWAYVSASNHAANFDSAILALENGTNLSHVLKRGYSSSASPNPGFIKHTICAATGTYRACGLSDTHNVMVVEASPLVQAFPSTKTYSGTYSSGFPALSSLSGHLVSTNGNTTIPIGAADPTAWMLVLGALRYQSVTSYACTFARVRLEWLDPTGTT